MRTFWVCVAVGVAFAASAAAQQKVIVESAVRVNDGPPPWREATVAASRSDPNEVVVAAIGANFYVGIQYRTSFTGGTT